MSLDARVSSMEFSDVEIRGSNHHRGMIREVLLKHEKVSQCYFLGARNTLGMNPILDAQDLLDVIKFADGFIVKESKEVSKRESVAQEKLKDAKAGIAGWLARKEGSAGS